MNKKKKTQLIILCTIFLLVASAVILLKIYQKNTQEEDGSEEAVTYQILDVEPSVVTEIGIITEEETTNLIRENGTWKCLEDEDVTLNGDLINDFLESICHLTSKLQIENVEDFSQYGLDTPAVSVTLQWDSNMYTLKLGNYNSMISSYYVNVNDEAVVYTGDSSLYYTLNKSLGDFENEATSDKITDE